MGIGQLLSQAWREYRANAVVSARIMALYYILPMIVAIGIILFVVFGTGLIPSFQEFGTSLTDLSNIDAPEGLADAERTAQTQAAAEKMIIRAVPAFMAGIVLVLAFFFISFFACFVKHTQQRLYLFLCILCSSRGSCPLVNCRLF